MVVMLQRGWHRELASLVASAEKRLVVAAPFMSETGVSLVEDSLSSRMRTTGRIEVLTDLSPSHVADGSLEPGAVLRLCRAATISTIWHVPRFHAKVYIADESRAIVTSGNLTASAYYRNSEYGILIDNHDAVAAIQSHFDDFREAGTSVPLDDLIQYARVATEVRSTSEKQRKAADPRLARALQSALKAAEDQLIRFRLAGGALHTVFAKTIQYLLAKYGPMLTIEIHEYICSLHPDLCDDSVDRVIDGQHFGKKWKHAVRTAQQQLKKSGIVEYSKPFWKLR